MNKQERITEAKQRITRYENQIANLQKACVNTKVDLDNLQNGMTMDSIKQAWEDGETVCWASDNYEILKDCIGQWLIHSRDNDHYVGLTEAYVKDCYIKRD